MRISSVVGRKAATVLVAVACALGMPLQAAAEKTITWRVQSHWPSASSSYKDSLGFLKERLEERTNGRLVLELHEAGSLFPAKEIYNAVNRGIIQMGTLSPAYLRDRLSLAGIAAGLPFAFRNTWEAAYFHKHLGFEEMLREEAAENGIYYSTDKVYPTEMVVTKPIKSLEDFKKLKLRSSGTLQKFLTEAGAAASYLPGPELYPALSQGVVDGAHWGAAQGAMSMSLYEVAKYHVLPPLNIAGTDAFIINLKALNNLPADIRKTVVDTLDEQFWLRTNEYTYKEKLALAKAQREQGVEINVLPEDVQNHLAKVAVKSWEEEGKRSDRAAEALSRLKAFLNDLGYL